MLKEEMKLDLNPIKFTFPCGDTPCGYPGNFCDYDQSLPSRSRCFPCSEDVCSTFGNKNFPEECKIFCNQDATKDVSSESTYWLPLYFSMGLNILFVCLVIVFTVNIIYRRRIKSARNEEIPSSICLCTKKLSTDNREETSVMLPSIQPSTVVKGERQGCTPVPVRTPVSQPEQDLDGQRLSQYQPQENSPTSPQSDVGYSGSQRTEGQNYVTTPTDNGVHGSHD
ncbi:hypothetical protein FSP39_013417 [Pinctada imbricata]|uniref:Uncharacterized protein n=1 Tax=Pinctada imbricata TaxID=66713 RepID=A0AA89BVL7_PINIB|nr:hypothetical protein FSP39_013417 [Pinctada imbricata]